MTDENEKEEMIANELSVKLREMMKHGDPELKEMVRETVRGLHNFMMDDPKSRAEMKSKEKGVFGGKVIPFPTGLVETQSSETFSSEETGFSKAKTKIDPKQFAFSALIGGLLLTSIFVIFSFLGTPEKNGKWCDIKGNINTQGEKIFHMPGDQWYEKTTVDESRGRGEKWFCSEKDAIAAGFRPAMH